MKRRKVVIEFKAKMIVEVPSDWNAHAIDFWLNDSSHCLANEVRQLADEADAIEGTCSTCHRAEGKYLRDASSQDIEDLVPHYVQSES